MFFKGTAGAFLVFDLSRRETFENLDKWLSKIEESCDPKVVTMLIGNKCDLPSRQISHEEAMAYAQSKQISYMEVSAKTGINVKNVFSMVATNIHRVVTGNKASG